MESIDYWYHLMNQPKPALDEGVVAKMVEALEAEYPRLCSLILERACNLQCLHCIFQPEKTSLGVSQAVGYSDLACHIISQMGPDPSIIHEGRIVRDWHLSLFATIRKLRPDAKIGLIDNGTYLRQEKHFREQGFLLDWMDISFDGTKEVHNTQRNNATAFDVALKGAQEARCFIRPKAEGGKVTSLFTVTNLNYHDVYNTAAFLFGQGLIDEFHITPFSPVRTEIEPLFFLSGL